MTLKKIPNLHEVIESLSLEDITIFLEKGDLKNAPEGVADYLNILEKTRGMLHRFGDYSNDDIIVNCLNAQDGINKKKAREIVDETREFFNTGRNVSIEAWRNIYADKMDRLINLGMMAVKDLKDIASVGKLIKDAYDIRGGNDKGSAEIPLELLERPTWTIYTSDVTDLGLPKANRNALKELINNKTLELSEKEKNHILREASVLPFKLFPHVEENARKS